MPQIKHEFSATGQSTEFPVVGESSCRYYADFTTGSGVGTVQLEMQIKDDWLPADTAITADMNTVEVSDAPSTETTNYRWNCTAYTSGTITVYLG